jgi:hypothetical protein
LVQAPLAVLWQTEPLVSKLETVCSVLDKKVKRRCHVLTQEKLYNIGARLEHFPRKSLAKMVWLAEVLVASARTATKLLKLCPVK